MTDWDLTDQVRGGSLHRSDRSPLTGQTGLIGGRSKFVLQDKCTVSRKRKMRYIPQLIQKKAKADDEVQICNIKVDVSVASTRPMVFDKSVNPPVQRPIMDNDHEASSSNSTSKYFQPRWCPPGLTRTQRRKLQCLRAQEKKDQEFKRLRDKQFNNYRPMVPQGKVWRVKAVDQPALSVEPPQATGLTARSNRSDRLRLQQNRKPNWNCLFWLFAMEKHR